MLAISLVAIVLAKPFDLHEKASGLDLSAFLRDRRTQNPPMSLAEIVEELAQHGIRVSTMTVSRWCRQRDIAPSRPRAPRQPRTSDGESAQIVGEARVPAPATPPESAFDRELRLSREQNQ